jgi:HK97 family phage major capsid protein
MATDFSGIIPIEYSTQIIEEATRASAVLALANKLPMGTKIASMPIPKTLPVAAFVSTPGGRKAYADVGLQAQQVTAEEIAVVLAIPDVWLEDSTVNLWNWVRPKAAEAIGVALDAAVMFGVGAPASYPPGGITAPAFCTVTAPATGDDAAAKVNLAMSTVEQQGVAVTGTAADLVVKGALRGVRDLNGALLMGFEQINQSQINTLYGEPVTYTSFTTLSPNLITGGWQNLVLGVRQDISFEVNPAGVIADATGKVLVSGFQDNTTPMKIWCRFGCTCVNPVTIRNPAGAKPFASSVLLAPATAAAEGEKTDKTPAKAGSAR